MMWQVTLCFIACQIVVILSARSMNDEARLIWSLMRYYEKSARPVMNSTTALEVKHGMNLMKLDRVDYQHDRIVFDIWEKYEWTDEYLTWDPAKYGGISSIRLPIDKIYQPDVVLFTVERRPIKMFDALAVVYSNGMITWISPNTLYSICSMPKRVSRGTEVSCDLKFGSWTYDGLKLDLQLQSDKVDTSYYTASDEWTLVEAPAVRHVVKYPCCPEPYIDVTYTLKLRKT